MAHPLAGCRLKLVRAQKHFNDISEVLRRLEHGECELIPEKDEKAKIGMLRIRLSPKPPDDLSVMVGDCLFNARSALDHLIWQLVLANGKMPDEWLYFPISKTAKAFTEAVGKHGRLDGVSAKAIAVIETLQPYHGQDEHPLALLSKLHNVDKHQKLNLITVVARDTELVWERSTADGLTQAIFTSVLGNEELCDGAVMPVDVPLDSPDFPGIRERFEKVKVHGQAAMFVAFEDRLLLDPETVALEERHTLDLMLEHLRIDWVLEEILKFIRDRVLPAFEPFFN
jgi:hypothetical protein